jgi:hypothetical protein
MLRVHFTAEDLTRTVVTAAPDPLWEVLLSGFRLRERCRPVSFRPWMAALAAHRPHATMVRTAAVCCESWLRWAVFPGLPDPDGRPPRIERRPGRVVQYSAARVTGPTRAARAAETLPDWVRPLADGETAVVTGLADVLRAYHDAAIAPHAKLVGHSVAADHAHRMTALANGGLDGLFASMNPLMRWRPPVLEVDYGVDKDLYLRGRGIRFVPSYFCHRVPVSLADPELPPTLVYPIGQQFRWSHATRAASTHSLDALLTGHLQQRVSEPVGQDLGAGPFRFSPRWWSAGIEGCASAAAHEPSAPAGAMSRVAGDLGSASVKALETPQRGESLHALQRHRPRPPPRTADRAIPYDTECRSVQAPPEIRAGGCWPVSTLGNDDAVLGFGGYPEIAEAAQAARSSRSRRCRAWDNGENSCCSTARTATLALRSVACPARVSLVGSSRPWEGWSGRVSRPRSCSRRTTRFIDWRVTKARRASSELDSPGSWPSSSRHAYWATVRPSGRSTPSIAVCSATCTCLRT